MRDFAGTKPGIDLAQSRPVKTTRLLWLWIAVAACACAVACSAQPRETAAADGGGGSGGGGGAGGLAEQCTSPDWSPPPCPRADTASLTVGVCVPDTMCNVNIVIADGYHYCHPTVTPYICCPSGLALVPPADLAYCPSDVPSPGQDVRCTSANLAAPCSDEGLACDFLFDSDGAFFTSTFACCGSRWRVTTSFRNDVCTDGERGLVCNLPHGETVTCGDNHRWTYGSVDAATD
jgi:hypothetical protein